MKVHIGWWYKMETSPEDPDPEVLDKVDKHTNVVINSSGNLVITKPSSLTLPITVNVPIKLELTETDQGYGGSYLKIEGDSGGGNGRFNAIAYDENNVKLGEALNINMGWWGSAILTGATWQNVKYIEFIVTTIPTGSNITFKITR